MSVVKTRHRLTELVAFSLVAFLAEPSLASQSRSRSAISTAVQKPKEVVTKLTCEVVLIRREDGAQIEKSEGDLLVTIREVRNEASTNRGLYLAEIVGTGVTSFQFEDVMVDGGFFSFPSDEFVWELDSTDSGKGGPQRGTVSINRVSGAIVYQEVRRTSQDPYAPPDEELRVTGSCKKMDKELRKF